NTIDDPISDPIVCQLELRENIVVNRGDRFIIRRPSPAETIGGGWVIDPHAKKQRYGQNTVQALMLKKEGSADKRVISLLSEQKILLAEDIIRQAAITEEQLIKLTPDLIKVGHDQYTTKVVISELTEELIELLIDY